MEEEPGFRSFVLQAFARRMADVTRLLERVAFGRIEARLAQALLDLAEGGVVQATQVVQVCIGSAREVISRRLDAFARRPGWRPSGGEVRLCDLPALRQLAATLVTRSQTRAACARVAGNRQRAGRKRRPKC